MADKKMALPREVSGAVLTDILNSLYDGVYCVDRDMKVVFWSHTAQEITGYSLEDILGRNCSDNRLCHVDEGGIRLCDGLCPLHQTLLDGERREVLAYLRHKSGHRVPVYVRTSPVRSEDGSIVAAIQVFSEAKVVQKLVSENQHLRELSFTDSLTGLPNRRQAEEKLAQADFNFQRYGHGYAVMILDVDNFKSFNDIYGHDVGDKVLQMVANTLQSGARKTDFVSRWGGDEFMGIFPELHDSGADATVRRLSSLIESSFLEINNEPLSVTVSIGICAQGEGHTTAELLRKADENLFISKQLGKNCITSDALAGGASSA